MRTTTSIGLAFGMLLVAAAPMQAAHKHAHKYSKHAHATEWAGQRHVAAAERRDTAPQKSCTYIGGPKSPLWACR